MAKLVGPLFSQGAHGSIGNALTFSLWRAGNQVRFQKKQKDVTTTPRTTQRNFYIEAYEHWNTLSDNDKLAWDTFNKG